MNKISITDEQLLDKIQSEEALIEYGMEVYIEGLVFNNNVEHVHGYNYIYDKNKFNMLNIGEKENLGELLEIYSNYLISLDNIEEEYNHDSREYKLLHKKAGDNLYNSLISNEGYAEWEFQESRGNIVISHEPKSTRE